MQSTLFTLKIFSEMSVEEAKRKAAFAAVDNHVKKGQVESLFYFLIKKMHFKFIETRMTTFIKAKL